MAAVTSKCWSRAHWPLPGKPSTPSQGSVSRPPRQEQASASPSSSPSGSTTCSRPSRTSHTPKSSTSARSTTSLVRATAEQQQQERGSAARPSSDLRSASSAGPPRQVPLVPPRLPATQRQHPPSCSCTTPPHPLPLPSPRHAQARCRQARRQPSSLVSEVGSLPQARVTRQQGQRPTRLGRLLRTLRVRSYFAPIGRIRSCSPTPPRPSPHLLLHRRRRPPPQRLIRAEAQQRVCRPSTSVRPSVSTSTASSSMSGGVCGLVSGPCRHLRPRRRWGRGRRRSAARDGQGRVWRDAGGVAASASAGSRSEHGGVWTGAVALEVGLFFARRSVAIGRTGTSR